MLAGVPQELLLLVSEAHELSGDALERGLKLALDSLDLTAIDVPFAPALVGAQPDQEVRK